MSRDTTVRLASSDGLRVDITSGPHHLVGDEPKEGGGGDAGPAPHDFLCVGLACCTAMTLRIYAKRKQWPLENADVTVRFVEQDGQRVMQREIHLHGALDDEQKRRLLEIAEKCPVHKTLSASVKIASRLV